MGVRPTRRMVPAFSGIPGSSTIPGCFGNSSPFTTGARVGSTVEPTATSIESTLAWVGSTEPMSRKPTDTTTEPPTFAAERTTYPSGADRLTVKAVDVPGSKSGHLTVNPPNVVSLVEFFGTGCGPCKGRTSKPRDLRSRFGREKGSSISSSPENEPDAVRAFWKEHVGTGQVGVHETPEVTQEFGIRGYPTRVILLPDGSEPTRHLGSGGDHVSDIESAIEGADPT